MTNRVSKKHALDSREGLLDELQRIDVEGWGGAAGEALLSHVRRHIVRPQVVAAGLRGPVAEQAEATGWEVAWETLRAARLRTATSPWGLLWVAVGRAIQGELRASMYLTGDRNGWRVRRDQEISGCDPRFDPPASLSRLIDLGWEREQEPTTSAPLGRRLDIVIGALVRAGWDKRAAHAVVEAVAVTASRNGTAVAAARGWRPLAGHLGLPPWQVRRVMVVLLGAPGWPGALERMATAGPGVMEEDGMKAALRSTIVGWWPTPVAAAQRANPGCGSRAMQVAS